MLSYLEFNEELDRVVSEIPEQYFVDLNGGISVRRNCKVHPLSVGEELCVMGEYIEHRHLGRMIVLYYGSFLHHYGYRSDEFIKKEIKRVFEHELTHHLEHLAGEKDLDLEDEKQLYEYALRHKIVEEDEAKEDPNG